MRNRVHGLLHKPNPIIPQRYSHEASTSPYATLHDDSVFGILPVSIRGGVVGNVYYLHLRAYGVYDLVICMAMELSR